MTIALWMLDYLKYFECKDRITPKLDSTSTPMHADAIAAPAVKPIPRKLFISNTYVETSSPLAAFLYSLYFLALPLTISLGYLRSFCNGNRKMRLDRRNWYRKIEKIQEWGSRKKLRKRKRERERERERKRSD